MFGADRRNTYGRQYAEDRTVRPRGPERPVQILPLLTFELSRAVHQSSSRGRSIPPLIGKLVRATAVRTREKTRRLSGTFRRSPRAGHRTCAVAKANCTQFRNLCTFFNVRSVFSCGCVQRLLQQTLHFGRLFHEYGLLPTDYTEYARDEERLCRLVRNAKDEALDGEIQLRIGCIGKIRPRTNRSCERRCRKSTSTQTDKERAESVGTCL